MPGIVHDAQPQLTLRADESVELGNIFLVKQKSDYLMAWQSRNKLEVNVQTEVDLITLETVEIGLSEVVYHRRTRKYHQQ